MTTPSRLRGRATGLTGRRREREVLDRLIGTVRGGASQALVVRGDISARTVRYHLRKVFVKLDISSRTRLDGALPTDSAGSGTEQAQRRPPP
jgi:DNA-binding CsgD family transcriptional regulator